MLSDMSDMSGTKWLTTADEAARRGVSQSTIRRWVQERKIVPDSTTEGGQHRWINRAYNTAIGQRLPTAVPLVIIQSPDGGKWEVTVSNDGVLSALPLGSSDNSAD